MSDSKEYFLVEVTTPIYGGECMGRLPDGRAVFIPYTLPGEQVRVQLVEQHRGFARARLVEVVRPSPQRITPRCIHYGVCGGCHFQHTTYANQLKLKQAVVRDQLERIGGIVNPLVDEVIPSPAAWNYRNALQFHLTAAGKLGYQGWGTHNVVPISECHLPEDALDQIWPQLDLEPLPGIERVELRLGAQEEVLLALESSEITAPEFSVDIPLSAVHLSPAGKLILAGEDYLLMEVRGRVFKVSAESFFQVNTAQAEAMVDHILKLLLLDQKKTVLDVYCGVGLFSAFIAPRVKKVIGVELSESACEDYAVNLDEFDNVELYVGAAEQILPALKIQSDIVVVDPPRAGIERQALDALIELKPDTIAYVSCDPATLARDLKRLNAAGYRLERVTPFDLFPQTFHVETVCLMSRA
ncbi:MAG TPA: class I SAM-dependent RNA methyltransferase [Bellilinea sp.]|nr:class I SAM-dependent RNA methyltransferase [Bellilinea sp.]